MIKLYLFLLVLVLSSCKKQTPEEKLDDKIYEFANKEGIIVFRLANMIIFRWVDIERYPADLPLYREEAIIPLANRAKQYIFSGDNPPNSNIYEFLFEVVFYDGRGATFSVHW